MVVRADLVAESELRLGPDAVVGVDRPTEGDELPGPHYCDLSTEALAAAAAVYEDLLKMRLATDQRGMRMLPLGVTVEFFGKDLKSLSDRAAAQVSRLLRKHPLWPWLKDYPGLGGVHTARLMGYLRDPHRFPGARSVWHYCGLHVVDGRSPRQRKGLQGDWNPKARTAVLMPGGIAEQIVKHRVAPYREKYDATKERLQRERGVERRIADEQEGGPALASPEGVALVPVSAGRDGPLSTTSEGVAPPSVSEVGFGPLRPFQIDAIARKVAAKAFVADLWTAWKGEA